MKITFSVLCRQELSLDSHCRDEYLKFIVINGKSGSKAESLSTNLKIKEKRYGTDTFNHAGTGNESS
jgi:hypothetical protein